MTDVAVFIGIILIIYVAYRLYQHLFPSANIAPNGKYVLISGCDTGFGHALAIELDKQGFHVLAGIYNTDNQQHLTDQLSSRATVFSLDITDDKEIDDAYDLVKSKTNTLHALVNNAGIDKPGLIDWVSVDSIREVMEVNFFGHVTMTKKFLPLLISRRGSRVVNVCSVAGYIAGTSMAGYTSSKFALEAFSDCLRREMAAWGLHVSIIEPGFMRTPIIEGHEHLLREVWNTVPEETQQRWGEAFADGMIANALKNTFIVNAENPRKVIKTLHHAVMNSKPRIRYRPGWQSSLFFFPLSMLPAWVADFIVEKTHFSDVQPVGLRQQHI